MQQQEAFYSIILFSQTTINAIKLVIHAHAVIVKHALPSQLLNSQWHSLWRKMEGEKIHIQNLFHTLIEHLFKCLFNAFVNIEIKDMKTNLNVDNVKCENFPLSLVCLFIFVFTLHEAIFLL